MKGENYAFILIASEEYWERLCQRCAQGSGAIAFVRKGQVGPIQTKKLIFYIKKPVIQIRGFADFSKRLKGDKGEMWVKYGKESCFESEEEYNFFVQGREKVTFLMMKNLTELYKPTTGEQISLILGSLRGFRGKYVDRETAEALIT